MGTKKEFIIGAVVLFLGAIALAGSVWFAFYTLSTQQKAGATEIQVEEETRRSAYALSVRSLLRDVAREERVVMGITDKRDIVAFVQLIEDTGAQAGTDVSVDAVSLLGKNEIDQNIEEYVVSVRATGTYQQVIRFIALLEELPHPLYLEQALIEDTKTAWEGTFRIQTLLDSEESRLKTQ